jgi:class 3 adenylate cyclase
MSTIAFSPERSEAQDAIVVSLDLTGFSEFCNHADAHASLPKFLSKLFDELNDFFLDPLEWMMADGNSNSRKVSEPRMIKFTGDGAIMVWTSDTARPFTESFCSDLVAIMRKRQERITQAIPKWEKEFQITDLPKQARFGIAKGLVYGLYEQNHIPFSDPIDYVGYCINLAVRLQNHCPEIGFIVHQNLHPLTLGMVALKSKGIKGTKDESVRVFQADLNGVDRQYWLTKFTSPS